MASQLGSDERAPAWHAALPPIAWSRRAAIGAAIAATLLAGLTASDDGPILCLFRRCTGGYCPGCGMTRSASRLVRGDLAGSWQRHPYLLLALGQLAVLAAATWLAPGNRHRRWLRSHAVAFVVANAALLVAIWLARLSSGSIPAPFS